MIATSDCTAPSAMRIAATMVMLTGSCETGRLARRGDMRSALPSSRKRITGMPSVPTTPIGSRRKIFVSIQLSLRSPFSIARLPSVPDRPAGELEEDILERRHLGAEAADARAVARDGVNDLGDEVVALA